VTAANEHHYDTDLLDTLAQRVVAGDGAVGTQLQAADLAPGRNTFGCNLVNLAN